MFKLLASLLKFVATKLNKLSKIIHIDVQEKRANKWYALADNKNLRFEYDLNSDSIVFDLGGYEGQWASDIYSKYNCNIYIFEPVVEYANQISKRFENNKKIKVFAYGLSDNNSKAKISLLADSSSLFKTDNNSQEIELISFLDFVSENKIINIDLIKINIEGGEFPLLESIVNSDYVNKINNYQIQFHDFVEDADKRMKAIQTNLSRTHKLTYQVEFIWENWVLL